MINSKDAFGRMMKENITLSGYAIPGLDNMVSPAAVMEKYTSSGFEAANALTMLQAYHHFISPEEKIRITKIEMLDELEEWELLMRHYSFSIGVKGPLVSSLLDMFPPV